MARFKKRINWKGIVAAVLTVATLLGVAAGITAFVKNDTKTISSLSFSKGDLDENGKYVASETALYTKDAFECIGLRVQPDFEFRGTYDVCYYDCDERIIEKISGFSGIYDEDYPRAELCRIVIHPELEEDQEKISFFDVNGIASKVKITVNKKQEYLYRGCANLYVEEKSTTGKSCQQLPKIGDKLELVENLNTKISEEYAVGEYQYYDMFIRRPELQSSIHATGIFFTTADDIIVSYYGESLEGLQAGEWCKISFEVPKDVEEDMSFMLRLPIDAECVLYGYNK